MFCDYTCTRPRYQASIYRTIVPLVQSFEFIALVFVRVKYQDEPSYEKNMFIGCTDTAQISRRSLNDVFIVHCLDYHD